MCLGVTAALLLSTGCGEAATAVEDPAAEVSYFNFRGASASFYDELATAEEGSELWQEAAYGYAVTLQHMLPVKQANIEEAGRLYQSLIDKTPDSRFAPRARLNLGRIAELRDFRGDPIDLPTARTHYQAVIDGWPDDRIAGEATFMLANTYVQTLEDEQVARGVAMLEDWLAKADAQLAEARAAGDAEKTLLDIEPLASAMWYYLGELQLHHPTNTFVERAWHDNRRALHAFIRAVDAGLVQRGQEGTVYWRIAMLAMEYRGEALKAVGDGGTPSADGDAMATSESAAHPYLDAEGQPRFDDPEAMAELAAKYSRKIIFESPNSGLAYPSWLRLKIDLQRDPPPFEQMLEAGRSQVIEQDATTS